MVYRHIDEWRSAMTDETLRRAPVAQQEEVPGLVRRVEEELERISALLDTHHGTPDLGNHEDPLDELVYIILSRRTREEAYRQAFEALRSTFDSWKEVAQAPVDEIAETISASGLPHRKATSIKAFLGTISEELGEYSLDPLRQWDDERALQFLDGLPGVGTKSALCVMLYSLHRPVFPADAHVGRVLARLGVLEPVGINLLDMEHRPRQSLLREAIPPHLRHDLHVNLVMHGRFPCRSMHPACESCPLLDHCRRRGLDQTVVEGH